MDEPTVFWFRRDLRLADNPALVEAARSGPVLGLFVVDPRLWDVAGAPRRGFLVDCLRALDRSMGGRLVVRTGDPAHVVPDAARDVGADTVRATADFGPYGRDRDARVTDAVVGQGGRLCFDDSPYAVAPGTVTTGTGTPYRVFTPFYRTWSDHGWNDAVPEPDVVWLDAATGGIPDRPDPGFELPPAGEGEGHARLEAFLDSAVTAYDEGRDRPGQDGTSRLSPHLKWGTLHPRQILTRLGTTPGEEAFRRELAWREFYADVLFHRPETARQAFNPKMAGIEVDSGPATDERFEAWALGETGYPIVDAGMRQLLATGWMPNRVRMIAASFLVKDLHLDWTRGARWFMTHLVDGDLASNSHGWQWVAGTGTDAAPYFRVFNPVTQAERFDPDGSYVRSWLPMLAHLPGKRIHRPWADRVGPPAGYPAPIVDHGEERAEALARYEARSRTGPDGRPG